MKFDFLCCLSSPARDSPHASLAIATLRTSQDIEPGSEYEDADEFSDARSCITNFSVASSLNQVARRHSSLTSHTSLFQDLEPSLPNLPRIITRRSSACSLHHSSGQHVPPVPLTSHPSNPDADVAKNESRSVARRTSTSLSARILSSLFHRNILDPMADLPLKPVLPPWIPSSPLRFITTGTRRFVKIPDSSPLIGFWLKDNGRSTKDRPMPIDKMIKANWIARRAHESITGIKLGENKTHLTVKCKITIAGVSTLYGESYAKDGGSTSSRLRRDLKGGRALFRAFYLEDSVSGSCTLILLMETTDLYGSNDFYGEEEVTLADPDTILFVQHCFNVKTTETASQIFYGSRVSNP